MPVLIIGCQVPSYAYANLKEPLLQLNGFLSAGAVYTKDRDLIIDAQTQQITESDATVLHSAAGIQLDSILSDEVRFSAQLVGTGLKDNFNVRGEWAYGAVQLHNNVTLRTGRLRLPTYIVSDFYEVGFAFPWVNPPPEVYFLSPISNVDGADLLIQKSFSSVGWLGDVDLLIQPVFGQSVKTPAEFQLPIALDLSQLQSSGEILPVFGNRTILLQAEDISALNLMLQSKHLNIHLNYTETLLRIEDATLDRILINYADIARSVELAFLVALLDGSYATGASDLLASTQGLSEAQIQDLIGLDPAFLEFTYENAIGAHSLLPEKIEASFSSLGFEWKSFQWTLVGEYAYRDLKDLTISHAWYLTLARQWGPWLPHATFAAVNSKFVANAAALSVEQASLTIGLRFQYSESVVFKSDLTRIEPDAVSGGIFQVGADETVDTLNVAIESIF